MNLKPLYEEAIQFNNFNGTVLAAGKVEVWYLGRTRKADIYADVAGETPLPNPFDLNNLGMQQVYVNPAFNYTLVVYDPYGSELFSVDKYLQGAGVHTTSDVVVQPSENIGVSAWTVGEVQIYQPYLIGDVGKTYEGILPVVVNNDEDKISANHVPLGLQEPLYFVEDSESACIIGCSAQSELPEGTMNESAFSYDASSNITAYNGSAFKAGDEFPESATEVINVVTANSATWNGPYVPLGSGNTANFWSIAQGNGNSAAFWSMAQGSENTANDRSLAQGSYNTAIGDSLAQGVYNYAEDESMAQGEHNSAYKHSIAQGDNNIARNNSQAFGEYLIATASGMAIGQYNLKNDAAFVIGNGISATRRDIFVIDHSGNVSAQGDISASGVSLTSFYTDYQTNSANFVTALPEDLVYTADITGFATTADLTSKLDKSDSANFYTTANESGFITGIPDEVTEAASTVVSNSANWNSTYETVSTNSASWTGGGTSYTSPSGSIWISGNNIESTDSAYIPSHTEDVLLTAISSWSSTNGYATLANTNKVYFIAQGRASAFDNEGTFLNSSYNSTVSAETEYPPIKLYTTTWVSVKYSAYSAGIMDAYTVELARKNEVNSALNRKLDSSAFTGYYPSNNPSGFAKSSDVVLPSSFNLFNGKVIGVNNQNLMGCDSAYNYNLVRTSSAPTNLTASAYVGTGHQGVTIQISARNTGRLYINWTAFGEDASNLSAGQMSYNADPNNKISAFSFNSPIAENISGVKLYGNNVNFTAYSAYTSDVKQLASQDNITFISGAIDYVSANAGGNGTVDSPLGLNETVLWSGNVWDKNIEMVLSDSLKNYDSYKVYGYNTENKYGIVNEYTYNSAGPNWFSLTDTRIQNNAYLTIYGSFVSANPDWDKLTITYMSNKYCISGGLTHSTTFGVGITKIVGINRKAQ